MYFIHLLHLKDTALALTEQQAMFAPRKLYEQYCKYGI